jgi:hypothetical protein
MPALPRALAARLAAIGIRMRILCAELLGLTLGMAGLVAKQTRDELATDREPRPSSV